MTEQPTPSTKWLYVRHLGISAQGANGIPWRILSATTGKDTPVTRSIKGGEPARIIVIDGPLADKVRLGDLIQVEW